MPEAAERPVDDLTCVYLLDPVEPHLGRARLSLASLRHHEPDVRVVVLLPTTALDAEQARALFPDADDVRLVDPLHATSGYFQDNCAHLRDVSGERLLLLDTDTIFFAPVRRLADRYRWADVAAAPSSWVWSYGYRTRFAPDVLTPLNGGVVLMSAAFCAAWAGRLPERHDSLLTDPDRADLVGWLTAQSATAYHRHELVLSETAWSGDFAVGVLGDADCYLLREQPGADDPNRWVRSTVLHTYGATWAGCVRALQALPALRDHPVADPGPSAAAGSARTPVDAEVRFDERWVRWTVEQLLAGRTRRQLVDTFAERGFPRAFAERTLRTLAGSPVFAAAERVHRPAAKLADWAELTGELATRGRPRVERRALEPATFYAEHYFPNRPVVLPGLMTGWAAPGRWSLDYFAEQFGDAPVEISDGRGTDPAYEQNFEQHRRTVPLRTYVEMIRDGGSGNDHYMVARNRVLDQPELRRLHDDFDSPDGFLDPDCEQRPHVRLWLGPAGTITPAHCDDRAVLFGQVLGRKHVRLVPGSYLRSMYNRRYCYSDVDLGAVDLARFPRMRGVPVLDVEVAAGEFLFIPLGWWHWVEALDVSASLTFTNFYPAGPTPVWRSATR